MLAKDALHWHHYRKLLFFAVFVLLLQLGAATSPSPARADQVGPAIPDAASAYIMMEERTIDWIRRERNSSERYKVGLEREYLAHWETVLAKNIETLKTHKSRNTPAFQKKFSEYYQDYNKEKKKLIHYLSASREIWGYITKGLDIGNLTARYAPVIGPGQSAMSYQAVVAENSRPDPFKLDDAELRFIGDYPRAGTDYWVDRDGDLSFFIYNAGKLEDAETVRIEIDALDGVVRGVETTQMQCTADRGGARGYCQTPLLEAGAKKNFKLKLRTADDALDLNKANDFRSDIPVTITGTSEEPAYSTVETRTITVRACVRAYRTKLEDNERTDLAEFQSKIEKALAPNTKLPGKPLREYSSRVFDNEGLSDIADLVSTVIWKQGIDRFLETVSHGYGEVAQLRNRTRALAEKLTRESQPGQRCADPETELAEIRDGLRVLKRRYREIHQAMLDTTYAAYERIHEFRKNLQKGENGKGWWADEAAKSAYTDRVFDGAELLGNFLAKEQLVSQFAGNFASVAGLVNSMVSIADSAVAAFHAQKESARLNETLGLLEAAQYMVGLRKRYLDLQAAFEAYLPTIEKAYRESCTCKAPF